MHPYIAVVPRAAADDEVELKEAEFNEGPADFAQPADFTHQPTESTLDEEMERDIAKSVAARVKAAQKLARQLAMSEVIQDEEAGLSNTEGGGGAAGPPAPPPSGASGGGGLLDMESALGSGGDGGGDAPSVEWDPSEVPLDAVMPIATAGDAAILGEDISHILSSEEKGKEVRRYRLNTSQVDDPPAC